MSSVADGESGDELERGHPDFVKGYRKDANSIFRKAPDGLLGVDLGQSPHYTVSTLLCISLLL